MAFNMRVGIVTLKMWRTDTGILKWWTERYIFPFALSFFMPNIARLHVV